MAIPIYLKKRLLPILINRLVIFLFLMCLFTLFLYAVGTVQGFVDSTQIGLLRLSAVLGIFLITMSIAGLILNVQRFFKQRKVRYLLRAGSYLVLALFGTATLIFAMFIISLSTGN